MSEVVVKKYLIRLDAEERARLEALIGKGKHSASTILRARILLKADISEAGEAWSDSSIVKALDTSLATVHRVRQCLVEEGLDKTLSAAGGGGSRRRQGGIGCPATPDFRERALQLARCLEGHGGEAGLGGGTVHPAWGVWRIEPSRYSNAGAISVARAGVTAAHSGQRRRRWRDRDYSAERCPGQRRCLR